MQHVNPAPRAPPGHVALLTLYETRLELVTVQSTGTEATEVPDAGECRSSFIMAITRIIRGSGYEFGQTAFDRARQRASLAPLRPGAAAKRGKKAETLTVGQRSPVLTT